MKFLNQNETLKYVLENRCSVSRFGDGPIIWFRQGTGITHPTGHQRYSRQIEDDIYRVFFEGSKKDNHLLCVYPVITDEDLEKSKQWSIDTNPNISKEALHNKLVLRDRLRDSFNEILNSLEVKPKVLGTTSYNRIRYPFDDSIDGMGYIKMFAKVFENRHVIYVSGTEPFKNPREDQSDCPILKKEYFKLAKSVSIIETPKHDAYESYDRIFDECLSKAEEFDSPEDVLFHLSFGPAASIMALDLSEEGYQSLDMGQYFLLEQMQVGMV